MSRISRAIGKVFVAPIVEVIDVDGVVQKIDLEQALSRVDLDAVLSRIDINALLDRVDLNYHLDRVDLNRLVERSNISAIVARSSSGVFDVVLDGARAQLVKADQGFQRLGRCGPCRRQRWDLPPTSGGAQSSSSSSLHSFDARASSPTFPNKSQQLALEAQGRYAGLLARVVANIFDDLILLIVFTIIMLLVETLVNRIRGESTFDANEWAWYPVLYYCFSFLYTAGCLAATGRTIGLTVCGLFVIKNKDGTRIGPLQAVFRTFLGPISAITIVGLLMGWVRKDGRQLHDIMTGTGVCYSWDAKLAYLRQQAMDELDDKQNV